MEVNKQLPLPAVFLETPARSRGCTRFIHRFPFCFPRMAAIFIITVLVHQTAGAAYQPPALLLERITDTVYIPDDHMAFLEDPERKYDLSTIREEDQFEPGPLPADIRQAETWWIQLRFESGLLQAQTWWLDIQGDYVDAYLISGAGDEIDILRTGFMRPFNRKAIQLPYSMWSNNIPIHLQAGESARLFIRVHHPTRRKGIRDPDYLVQPPYARLQLTQKRAEVNAREGAFQAILIMVILYLMVNYSQTRALSGIYLIGFCTLIGLYFLLVDEFLYQWAFPETPVLRYYLGFGLIYGTLIIADVFTRRILNLKALLPLWDTFLLYRGLANSFIMLGLLVTFYFSFNYDLVNTISNYYLIFLFAPSYLIFNLFLLKTKEQIAKFASLAGMTWAIPGVIALVGIQFFSMERELAFLILQAGVAGYIIIWVTALGYRAGKDRQEKWQARKIALKNEAKWQEEHRLAAELKELDATKSRFFANVSHELRTPLTLIIGPAKELQKHFAGKKGVEEEQNWLQLIRNNANQLLQLINEILELSRLEAGKMELHQRPVVLYPWLKRILSSFESLARDQAVELTLNCQLPPEKAYLLDPDKLERILTNLLSNAIKHTPGGGSVEVKAGRKGGKLLFQVLDTGPGVSPKDLPYIFDRYYQSKRTKVHIEGGTGIGLALSKEIANFLGGQIDAANRKEGGAVFSLLHPLQSTDFSEPTAPEVIPAPPETADAAAPLPDSPSGDVEGSTILLVEDHHDMRRYIENILQNRYPVVTCRNGKEALQYLMEHPDRHKVQLILSDVMMPVMDGFTLLEEVKKHPRLRLLPFMLLTARAGINSKLKAFRIGVDDYLIKPFEKAELLARIDSLLHNYHNRLQWTEEFSNMNKPDHKKLFRPSGFNEKEQAQLDNLEKITKKNLDNPLFNLAFLSDQLGVSKRNLNRITRTLVGLTPNRYIKKVRMEVARQLLETRQVDTVKEAVRKVGLQDPEHFSREFKKEYGRKPSDYL
jgi:signal transduction histidine kinase/CheY-like chemotaxis protein